MAYDSPFRVTYRFTANASVTITELIAVPGGVNRGKIRHISNTAPTFADAETATHVVNIGDGEDADAFASASLTVSADPQAASFDASGGGFEVDDLAALTVSRAANSAVGKPVTTTVVVDWY